MLCFFIIFFVNCMTVFKILKNTISALKTLYLYSPKQKLERSDGRDIAGSYFRPRRAAALLHQQQQRTPPTLTGAWKSTMALGATGGSNAWLTPTTNHPNHVNPINQTNHHHHHQMSLSRTWNGSPHSSGSNWQQFAIDGIQYIYRLYS